MSASLLLSVASRHVVFIILVSDVIKIQENELIADKVLDETSILLNFRSSVLLTVAHSPAQSV